MVDQAKALAALERIARLKADLELAKFAAFQKHVTVARQQVDSAQAALTQSYRSTAPLSIAEARMANVQAARSARELRKADLALARLLPRFDVARKEAAREFGRAEALREIALRHRQRRDSEDR